MTRMLIEYFINPTFHPSIPIIFATVRWTAKNKGRDVYVVGEVQKIIIP
jgi:hypothetical protein